jgi:hypothetical protein
MDLTARVTALEEEVSVLKGEIKTILQEVRTAVLARDNPFDASFAAVPRPQEVPAAQTPATQTAPPPPTHEASNGHNLTHLHEVPPASQAASETAPFVEMKQASAATSSRSLEAGSAWPAPRWSVHSLAALMSWTQESAQRFTCQDLGIVLSIARYGGLIDKDLEATLAELAQTLAPANEPQRATATDFLLALRQLDALLDEAGQSNHTEQPARRAS